MLNFIFIQYILNSFKDNLDNLPPETPEIFLDNPPTQSIDPIRPDKVCSWRATVFKVMNRNWRSGTVHGVQSGGENTPVWPLLSRPSEPDA